MAENNNKLMETEWKEYYEYRGLNEKEKQKIQEAFDFGIKEAIKEFLEDKYGNLFLSEDDARARLYYNIAKFLEKSDIDKRKLISSIHLEEKTAEKMNKKEGELDISVITPKNLDEDEGIVFMEIKSKEDFRFLSRNKIKLEEILKDAEERRISAKDAIKKYYELTVSEVVKDDFKKLKDEIRESHSQKLYFLFFDTHTKNETYEKEKAEEVKKTLEILRDGKDITWIYVIRYSEFCKKCPYKTGIVKTNDESIENYFKQNTPSS